MAGDYDLQSTWEAMEDAVLESYRRNMARHTAEEMQTGFKWPMWQAQKFRDLKRFEDDVSGLLKKYGGQSDRTVSRAVEDNFRTGISHADDLLDDLDTEVSSSADFFRANERRLGALQTAIRSDMTDAKRAVLRMTDDVFRQTIYKAQTFYSAGAATLWQAVDMASKDFLSRGLNCIEYSNGARVNIASYAEMALRASAKKAYMVGEGRRSAEYGVTLCQVTQYSACSETCRPWQGRVYIDDVYAGGKAGDGDYPLLSLAIENGLFHPNCRHIKQPWYDGISEELQPIDADEMGENYAAEQRQREIERNIRKFKRRALGSLDPKEYLKAQGKVKEWQQELRNHLADYPELRRNYAREKIYTGGVAQQKKSAHNEGGSYRDISPIYDRNMQAARKSILDVGRDTGLEYLHLRDADTGELLADVAEGGMDHVGLTPEMAKVLSEGRPNSMLTLHNHPSDATFSPGDLEQLVKYPALRGIEVQGNGGTLYRLDISGGARPEGKTIRADYLQALRNRYGHYAQLMKDGLMTAEEADRSIYNDAVVTLVQKYGWRYTVSGRGQKSD